MSQIQPDRRTSEPSRRFPGGWPLQLLPYLILLAFGLYLRSRWAEIPDPWISHWNGAFVADGWAPKTPLHVYAILLLGLGNLLLVTAVQWGLLRWKRFSDDPDKRRNEAQQLHATALICLGVEYLVAPIYGIAGLAPLVQTSDGARLLVGTILGGSVGGSLLFVGWIFLFLRRRWNELQENARESHGDDDADLESWHGGLFYSNPDDPRLVVPKRFGIGFTFNFAHRAAWISMILLVGVPSAVILLTVLVLLR